VGITSRYRLFLCGQGDQETRARRALREITDDVRSIPVPFDIDAPRTFRIPGLLPAAAEPVDADPTMILTVGDPWAAYGITASNGGV